MGGYPMRVVGAAVVGLVLGLAACGPGPAPSAGPAPVALPPGLEPGDPLAFLRPAVRPVPVPERFARAVEAGTRTLEGVPGPAYWQQRVNYRIDAELDPATGRLQGEETIVYHNRSPDTLSAVILHLYQNLFAAGQPRTESVPITGGMTVERVAVGGVEARALDMARPPSGNEPVYAIDGTLMGLRLPRPLAPGDSVAIDVAWSFTVPPEGAPRTGHIDHVVYNVAQWYPQVAVYDDIRGWNTWPYLGQGEFYLEYGDFDVSITVPEGWVVAATGTLQNPQEVLTEPVRERLGRALAQDDVVRVITEEDLGAGVATQRDPGGTLTWRFQARNVRDFAFATSNRYLWDATRAITPDANGDGRPDTVAIHALYRPEATDWRQAADFTRHAVEFHAKHWHPYIYPQMTSVEGPVYGMEYPMITFVQSVGDPRMLYTIINHEVAHEWFPMMVGSNEPRFAWQDEGLVTYMEGLANADRFPDERRLEQERAGYFQVVFADVEEPMMREADLYPPGPSFVVAAYSKPALVLEALSAVIGRDTLHMALREYARRWHLRHPMALDFFNTVESVAGRDLDWFWYPWWYETVTLDQAVAAVQVEPTGDGARVSITIEDLGGAPMPVPLTLELEDGRTQTLTLPVEIWSGGRRRHTETVMTAGPVRRVVIDADRRLPDVDRSNNAWTGGTGAP